MRRSKTWPPITERRYPSGDLGYVVNVGKIKGKRVRRTFSIRAKAEKFARRVRRLREKHGEVPLTLPVDAWPAAKRLHDLLASHELTLHDAYRHYISDVIPFLRAPNVGEITQRLLAQGREKGNRPKSIKTLDSFLGEFRSTFGQRRITDINEDELRSFCFRPELVPRTKRNRRAMASQLYNFAIANDWANKNLATRLPAPRSADKKPGILMVEEVQRLLPVADEFGFLGYVVLSLFGGIRPAEIQKLDWSLVHVDDGLIEIPEWVSKIHQAREVTINTTMAAWLPLCRRNSGPIVDNSNFYERLAAWRAAAQVENWPNDVLRHTFASNHVAGFRNAVETARQMGHIGGLRLLYKSYVAFVPEAEARRFWALLPDAVLTSTSPVAARAGSVTLASLENPNGEKH